MSCLYWSLFIVMLAPSLLCSCSIKSSSLYLSTSSLVSEKGVIVLLGFFCILLLRVKSSSTSLADVNIALLRASNSSSRDNAKLSAKQCVPSCFTMFSTQVGGGTLLRLQRHWRNTALFLQQQIVCYMYWIKKKPCTAHM
ncbi:hypothetical protein XENTR_v10005026 [Xenopus tropicalis]|nr:hypothetical protein XENTR_v10005026 [Xenopus tropicalis]